APPEETIQPDKPYRVRWTTILSLLTALVAAGTIALHLIGAIIHRQYLRHFAISSDLFPKPVDWILINGYYGLVDRFILFLVTVAGNLPWLV
ncbi:hypothetical protein, partial [Enterococcus sp. HPCN18]|uniref:hypothetical protein n=1 Tax=Enterococcus sp. HPCN18 TaxID=2248751 RepID=UPI001C65776A